MTSSKKLVAKKRPAQRWLAAVAGGALVTGTLAATPVARADPAPAASPAAAEPMTLAVVCKHTRVTKGAILGLAAGLGIGLLTGQKGLALAAMAVGGGVAGGLIGKHFDKKACEESQRAQQAALQSGETQRWASDDGKVGYTYSVDRHFIGSNTVNRDMPVVDGRIVDLSDLADARGTYEVSAPVMTVREAPRLIASSHVVDTYHKGDRLAVLGATSQPGWLLVSRDGKAVDGWAKAASLHMMSGDITNLAATTTPGRTWSVKRVALRPACIESHERFEAEGQSQNGPATQACRNEAGVFAETSPAAAPAKG